MFCGNLPCSCNGAKKKTKVARIAPPARSSSSQGRTIEDVHLPEPDKAAVHAAMKSMAAPDSTDVAPEHTSVPIKDEAEVTDPELVAALNVLEPVLHESEKARYASVLSTPEARAARWKNRVKQDG